MLLFLEFLGHRISEKGLQPTSKKVNAVQSASVPHERDTIEVFPCTHPLLLQIFAKLI